MANESDRAIRARKQQERKKRLESQRLESPGRQGKKTFSRRKKSPMEKERILSTLKSEAQAVGGNVISANEMQAAIKGLKTLTDKGPGRLKLALKGGGRAFGKNS